MIKDLYRMAIFAKVVERGSYSAASVALGLGKSVVSHHVQALERNLGIRLLNRSTRSLSLTEEGKRFYEPCLRIVHEAEVAHFEGYIAGVFTPKEVELLSISFDASYTHTYAPGTRRHIKGALKAGATMEEIMEVLKLCVVQGVQACNLGVPLLAEELERSRRSN